MTMRRGIRNWEISGEREKKSVDVGRSLLWEQPPKVNRFQDGLVSPKRSSASIKQKVDNKNVVGK
jgi:hypothetical protein